MDRVEQLRRECEKNKVVVEHADLTGQALFASLRRVGPKSSIGARLRAEGRHLRFEGEIRPRAYHHLELELARPIGEVNPFATQDLDRLRRQLERLGSYRARFAVNDTELLLELEGVKSLYEPLALCIKVWRELGPLGESHQVRSWQAREREREVQRDRRRRGAAADAIERFVETLGAATAHLSGAVARSGDNTVEARLTGAYDDEARLVVGFATTRRVIARCDLRLVADLPGSLPRLHIRRRGFWNRLLGFLDESLGDELLDEAWIADEPALARALVEASPNATQRLARHRGELNLEPRRLVVRVDELGPERVTDATGASLQLWEALTELARGDGLGGQRG